VQHSGADVVVLPLHTSCISIPSGALTRARTVPEKR